MKPPKFFESLLAIVRNPPILNGLLIFVLGLTVFSGVLVRVKVFRDYRSLSFDEACLAMNVLQRSYTGLLQPLDEDQGAPFGILFLMKAATSAFGEGEDALRSIPLVAGVLAIPLFVWLMVLLVSPQGPPLKRAVFWIASLLFMLHPALVHYSVEVKQYSSDVLVTLALLIAGLKFLRSSRRTWQVLGLAAAGVAAIPFSHPAVFTLGGIGLAWFFDEWKNRQPQSPLLKSFLQIIPKMGLVALLWGGCFGAIYLFSLSGLRQNSHLLTYWRAGFAPWPPLQAEDFLWYINRPGSMFESLSSNPFSAIAAFFSVLGAIFWLRKSRTEASLFLIPALLNLVTAFLNAYPFSSRLILYLVPAAILLTAVGIGEVAASLSSRRAWLVCGLAVVFLNAYPAAMVFDPALRGLADQNLRGVVSYVLKNWQDGDKIYVYYDARCQFRYYARQMNISPALYTVGNSQVQNILALQDWKSALRADLKAYLGKPRTWFVFSNYSYLDLPGTLEILDQNGKQLQSIQKTGASGYLYDLAP